MDILIANFREKLRKFSLMISNKIWTMMFAKVIESSQSIIGIKSFKILLP